MLLVSSDDKKNCAAFSIFLFLNDKLFYYDKFVHTYSPNYDLCVLSRSVSSVQCVLPISEMIQLCGDPSILGQRLLNHVVSMNTSEVDTTVASKYIQTFGLEILVMTTLIHTGIYVFFFFPIFVQHCKCLLLVCGRCGRFFIL